jgi:hypothetical protein
MEGATVIETVAEVARETAPSAIGSISGLGLFAMAVYVGWYDVTQAHASLDVVEIALISTIGLSSLVVGLSELDEFVCTLSTGHECRHCRDEPGEPEALA